MSNRHESEPLLKRAAIAAAKQRDGNGVQGLDSPASGASGTPVHPSSSYGSTNGSGSATPSRQDEISMPPKSILVPLCIATWVPVFVAALDSTIVATLVGSISASFNASEQSAWLGTSYLLSVCCFSPIYGRLCDILGRRYALLTALLTFSIGTLGCGLAPTMEWLLVARVVAGIGGGGLTTSTSAILSDVIPIRQRGLYQGLANIVYGTGNALGGPVGGLLSDTIGWRNAFLAQLPFLLIAIVLACFYVHIQPPSVAPRANASQVKQTTWERVKSIDILGCFTLVGSVAPILLGLSFMSSNDVPFRSPMVWGNLLGGVLCSFAFYYVENHVARAPILPIELVTRRTPGFAGLSNFFLAVVTHAVIYNFPLFFQAVRSQSSSLAGLHLVPNSFALSVGSVFAGLWMRRTGRYYRLTVFCSSMMLLSSVLFLGLNRQTPDWLTYVMIVPNGFGVTGVLTCTLLALINAVPRSEIAVATGMSYLFRTTGQVVGVATSGVLLQAMLKSQLHARLPGRANEDLITRIRHNLNLIKDLPAAQREAAIESYNVSLHAVFWLIAVSNVACVVCCYMMEDLPLPDAAAPATQTRAAGAEEEARRPTR